MLKLLTTQNNGNKLITLGLEEGNISRLKEGKPIYFNLIELGFEGMELMIMYGEDQENIRTQLRKAGLQGI